MLTIQTLFHQTSLHNMQARLELRTLALMFQE